MIEYNNNLEREISYSINKWYEQTITELEKEHANKLNLFLESQERNNALKQINGELQEAVGFTLHSIYPSLYTQICNNDFSQLDLFQPFYISKLSKYIKADLTFDEKLLFYKSAFVSYLKRYFFLGKLDWELAIFLHVFVNGYNSIKPYLTEYKWQSLLNELELFYAGTYGIQNSDWGIKFHSSFTNTENVVKQVWLAGFKNKWNPSMNFYYGPLTFMKFDNLDLTNFILDKTLLVNYLDTYNEPENAIRKTRGLPMVGEGWISETKLYYLIKQHFDNHTSILHHGRPKWLGRQHFDIYLPEYNIAIEFQGDQHYKPIDFFGGKESFEKNKFRDKQKKMLAEENNCHLIYVDKDYIESDLIQEITHHLSKNNKQ
jgi:hypothetical protein